MGAATITPTRVLDVDSHEMAPVELWGEIFGESIHRQVQDAEFDIYRRARVNPLSAPDITGDLTEIDHDSVWNLKGMRAPSAIDLTRRTEVLDEMGIERQLVFPNFGLFCIILVNDPGAHRFLGFDPERVDGPAIGRAGVAAHNEWAARVTRTSDGRVRPVGIVLTGSVGQMMRDTEALLADGVRALMVPANVAPAGTSPAAPALDPFWALVAEADVPVTIHLGTDLGFVASPEWANDVETFHPSERSTIELPIEPYRASIVHFCAENFLSTMVLGGVFERHPTLRFGVIELSAGWVGPLAERLDLWVDTQFRSRFAGTLSLPPSRYLARNVRVTPFHFEPVAQYLERYPQLADVYCYSSDYPHVEGGKESIRTFADTLRDVDDDHRDRFFARNAELLLPG